MSVIVAGVTVEQAAYSFDKPYAYLLPETVNPQTLLGKRVLVPFGRGNTRRNGVVVSVSEAEPEEGTKTISKVLDEQPVLSEELLRLAAWMKEQTFCSLYEACKAMLPSGLNFHMQVTYRLSENAGKSDGGTDAQKRVLAFLEDQGETDRERLLAIAGDDGDALAALTRSGRILRFDQSSRGVGDATVRTARLCLDDGEEPPKLTPKQREVFRLLQETGPATVKEICYFTGVTAGVVANLGKKGVIELYDSEVYRTPNREISGSAEPIALNKEQQAAYEKLSLGLENGKPKPALLFGVTGSGKTQVYLKVLEKVLAMGKTAIIMVPEISLTPQTIAIFKRRFGESVAVFHSRLSVGERLDEWKRVKRGEASIAIGTRSAVFAPFENLGLIVLDEEQEHTYKSESAPRYHARDVARFRAAFHGALLLLTSATPSIESFARASSGKYDLLRLNGRFGKAVLPTVETIDMRDEIYRGNVSVISQRLLVLLKETLSRGEQAILLLNRRGYNTYISCRSCGKVLTCDHCSISMAYHKANGRLMCHYCGATRELPEKCPDCGGEFIRMTGAGTQLAEDELHQLLPEARILRMDADTTMSRNAHSEKLTVFANGEYDILVGTQMVAKGLDFPNVALVGVLNADQVIYNSDYRAYERAFSLLTQVIGRAGRSKTAGRAVLQTVTPDNELISMAAQQDYDCFFAQEIVLRKVMEYPPYCDICMIGFVGRDDRKTADASRFVFDTIKKMVCSEYSDVGIRILGPAPAKIIKIGGKYRYRMILKCRNTRRFREMIHEALVDFGKNGERSVSIFVDMNPEGIL